MTYVFWVCERIFEKSKVRLLSSVSINVYHFIKTLVIELQSGRVGPYFLHIRGFCCWPWFTNYDILSLTLKLYMYLCLTLISSVCLLRVVLYDCSQKVQTIADRTLEQSKQGSRRCPGIVSVTFFRRSGGSVVDNNRLDYQSRDRKTDPTLFWSFG